MKRILSLVVGVFMLVGCTDRATEKKIAELESRIDKLESSKGNADATQVTSTPTLTPAEPVKEEKPEGPLPRAQYESIDHDFGTVNEGTKVSYTYKVRNTGEAPLIIQTAQPSCGCTVPEWTKDPIPVGGTGFVKAEFDTNGKAGVQSKTITVTANTWPKTQVLSFKAMVTPKDQAQGPTK